MIAPPSEQPTPSAPSTRPVRPVGVVLFAVLLGLAAGFCLLLVLGGLATALHGLPATSAASAAMNTGVMFAMTLLYAAMAAWALATLVGLLRMQPWARVSSMVIAGGMTGLGLLFALGMTGAQSLISSGSVPLPPNVDAAMLHKLLVFLGLLFLLVAVLGIAGLIYFARRSTRDLFVNRSPQPPAPQSAVEGAYPAPEIAPPWPVRSLPVQPRPDPLTDFTVARPLETPMPSKPSLPPAEGETGEPENGSGL